MALRLYEIISNTNCFFSELPFYWSPLTERNRNISPTTLPFKLIYDEKLLLLRQEENYLVSNTLVKVYKNGSEISGLMNENGIGKKYADDFLNYIQETLKLNNLSEFDVLEIGCGTGYLLNEIKNKGANVTGFEPGYSFIGKYDLPIIRNFFPSLEIHDNKYDLILAYNLLEHISKPKNFLKEIKKYLKKEGKVIFSVPDCTKYINDGDLSILIHEHYSYFTMNSLKNLFISSSFEINDIRQSCYGGNIYFVAMVKDKIDKISFVKDDKEYFDKIDIRLKKMKDFFEKQRQKSIGIYVPLRILNSLYLLKDSISEYQINIRFFDDYKNLYKKYLPTFDIPIENQNDLINNPTEIVLIMSNTFGHKIKDEIQKKLPSQTQIILYNEFC